MNDHLPPTGDWPGGTRYNLECSEEQVCREWTDEEKARAYDRRERLPAWWWVQRELWTDADGRKYGRWWWDRPADREGYRDEGPTLNRKLGPRKAKEAEA